MDAATAPLRERITVLEAQMTTMLQMFGNGNNGASKSISSRKLLLPPE